MEYTGNYKKFFSHKLGKNVSVLEYKSDDNVTYDFCSLCGKPIKRKMFVVQDSETDIELLLLGATCAKKFN